MGTEEKSDAVSQPAKD